MKTHHKNLQTQNKRGEHRLYQAVSLLNNEQEVAAFLQDLCTPAEIQAMADRWRVVELLQQNKPYRQIYEETGVSVTTVGRVARCLTLGEGGYNLIYKRVEKKAHENTKTADRHSKKR